MAAGRLLCLLTSAALLAPCSAQAAEVLVLQRSGAIVSRADPGVAARERRAPGTHLEGRAASARAARSAATRARRRPTVRALRALHEAGAIDRPTFVARRDEFRSFERAVRRFSGARRIAMAGVLATVDGIAARGDLTPSRIGPLWLTMARNREWWNFGPLLAPGQRVSFEGSELVWQHVPGRGLHVHPLANFGKLNALWRQRGGAARMEALLDELLPLAAERAGGLAWEYTFEFGGGRPPWVSGLAQGTGLQAMARAATRAGRAAEVLPVLRRGLGIFRAPPPEGVDVPGEGGGRHFLQYSTAPGLRILNGFVQSLVGLYDFAVLAADYEAQALFLAGEASARVEVPAFDTGAWSLYSRGSITRESGLGYHRLLRDFLSSLCDRTSVPTYCEAEAALTRYLVESPRVELVTRRLRRGRPGTLRFRLSKVSRVSVRVSRGRRAVYARSATVGYGSRAFVLTVPRRRGAYAVSFSATDLAGNSSRLDGVVEVVGRRRR